MVEKTKHHVLDTIAAMVSGASLLPGRKAVAYARTLGGTRAATVVGVGGQGDTAELHRRYGDEREQHRHRMVRVPHQTDERELNEVPGGHHEGSDWPITLLRQARAVGLTSFRQVQPAL